MKSVYLFSAILLLLAAPSQGVELVRDGKAASAIHIPGSPSPVEERAAAELQYHIRKATGAELPIQRGGDVIEESAVYVGNGQAAVDAGIDVKALPPAGYVVRTKDSALVLAGEDGDGPAGGLTHAGTLWAVYEFLERELGVRWVWPGELGEVIPHRDSLVVDKLDYTGSPRFLETRLHLINGDSEPSGWSTPEAKAKFYRDQETWLLRHRFGSVSNLSYGHAFADSWARFGTEHPEFFSLLPDGRRTPLSGDESGEAITHCVSQPLLWRQTVQDWAKTPAPRPYLNACENDSPGMCTCAACRAWDAPDPRFATAPYWSGGTVPEFRKRFRSAEDGLAGPCAPWTGIMLPDNAPSLSDRYARFYLALQEEASKTDSGAVVFGYAYSNYWQAPRETKLNDHIVISYVPPLWFPYTEDISKSFRENWDGWRATGARLVLRPNLTHAGHNMPIFYARQLAADFAYAAGRGLIGTAFDSLLGAWGTQGPTLYVLGRMHEHPDWPADRMLDEYYGAFGPAEAAVRRYFEHWEQISNALTTDDVRRFNREEGGGGGFKDYVRIADRLFTPSIMAEGRKRLDEAVAAAHGDELAERRVAYLDKGLRDAELTLAALAAHKARAREDTPATQAACREAIEALNRHRATLEADDVCNIGYMAYREQHGARWGS